MSPRARVLEEEPGGAASSVILEICVESLAGARAAVAGGADRLELCSQLALDGLMPEAELLAGLPTLGKPCTVLIRPRAGRFFYLPEEVAVMRQQIDVAKAAGAQAVAFGVLLVDKRLDVKGTAALARHARDQGLELCFHRAFDLIADPLPALNELIELGFRRVLTSGGGKKAEKGLPLLAELVERAGNRLSVVPAGAVRPENAAAILAGSGARELHSSAGMPPAGNKARVRALRTAIDTIPRP